MPCLRKCSIYIQKSSFGACVCNMFAIFTMCIETSIYVRSTVIIELFKWLRRGIMMKEIISIPTIWTAPFYFENNCRLRWGVLHIAPFYSYVWNVCPIFEKSPRRLWKWKFWTLGLSVNTFLENVCRFSCHYS